MNAFSPTSLIPLCLFFCTLFLSACANTAEQYTRAIEDAAVIESEEIVALPTIITPTVDVVTWADDLPHYQNQTSVRLSWDEVWVTLGQEVQHRCQTYPASTRDQHLQRLLGLPEKSEQRGFVVLRVNTADVFRPCADPSLLKTHCTAEFPEGISSEHQRWYARKVAASYWTPEGYPWTRLGYTYNWQAGASEVGPAEFVIKKGATVQVLDVIRTETYCSAESPP